MIFISYIIKITNNKNINYDIKNKNNMNILMIYDENLIDILEKLDNNKNKYIISDNILKLNKNKIKILLLSLFNIASVINIKEKYIKIHIFSLHILYQINFLLKIFKINSIIQNNTIYIYDVLSIYNYYKIISFSNFIINIKKL
jgi:hypothetical protein